MNVFFIPSWYPSPDHSISGVFIHDQIDGLTDQYSNLNAGISLWGQKDEKTLLYLREPLQNLKKILQRKGLKEDYNKIKKNWHIFYKPAFSWSKKIANGNIKGIFDANDYNLQSFQKHFGTINLIHAFVTFPGGYIAMKLSEKYGIPYIITEEMSPFRPDIFMNPRSRIDEQVLWPLKKASSVIAVSPFSADQIQAYAKRPVQPIPNMVNEDFFKPLQQAQTNNKFTFFTLGRMVEQKGIPILLTAISKLKNKEIHIRIGGSGEELETYKRLGEKLSLKNLKWLGELDRNQARLEFQNCHAFVLPSLHESMGVVFAEAIACGKPIIATNCGGPEYIVNESNGILAKVGDSDDLANKMDWMIENIDHYNTEIIREDFLKRFSQKVVTAQIMEIYEEALNNQSPPN